MKNSPIHPPVIEPLASDHRAVSLRSLSRRPSGHRAVKAYGHRAVTIRSSSRQRTAQRPFKHGYSALIFQLRFNLSAQTTQLDFIQHGYAASSAPSARGLVVLASQRVKQDKDKNSKGVTL